MKNFLLLTICYLLATSIIAQNLGDKQPWVLIGNSKPCWGLNYEFSFFDTYIPNVYGRVQNPKLSLSFYDPNAVLYFELDFGFAMTRLVNSNSKSKFVKDFSTSLDLNYKTPLLNKMVFIKLIPLDFYFSNPSLSRSSVFVKTLRGGLGIGLNKDVLTKHNGNPKIYTTRFDFYGKITWEYFSNASFSESIYGLGITYYFTLN